MSLFIASLNSGSNGNSYYIGNKNEAILVDAGISCRETERRMKRLELSLKKVKAIFVSHEHTDHIYGIPRLSRKHGIPIYITSSTLHHGRLNLKQHLSFHFTAHEPVKIGNLSIRAFPINHDASDPHSFIVTHNDINVGVFTDIGLACEQVKNNFKQCHAAFLEANYDEVMLHTGSYSIGLKERIRGGKGHLSNKQAAQLFKEYKPPFMSHLFLSHLSEENNSPKIVSELFTKIAGKTEIIVASRYEETQVYHIGSTSDTTVTILKKKSRGQYSRFQLSLFP
jgi:phosphoribosyl 1,2-cyclic phosphodiesterase